ncbi:MAG: hypothetical protein KJZ85_04705 [Rhodobacteraceae bacterium]|jgi:hypothetical protein|nr:hypothetical protein [Paracoccaceae bacterium]
MTEFVIPEDLRHVTCFKAPCDGRVVAILVRAGFDEFDRFPPFVDSDAERAHIQKAYNIDPLSERNNKAHITHDDWPLQLIILQRNPGATTAAHYHVPDVKLPDLPTRHQIILCQRGAARIGIFTTEGDSLGDAILGPNDLILMLEGHEVEFLQKGTRLIEIKQGPFPVTDEADKVDLQARVGAR